MPSATSDKKMRRPPECHVALAKVWFCIVYICLLLVGLKGEATYGVLQVGCKWPLCVKFLDSHQRDHGNSYHVFEFVASPLVYGLKASLDQLRNLRFLRSRLQSKMMKLTCVFLVDQFQCLALGKLPYHHPGSSGPTFCRQRCRSGVQYFSR